MKTAEEIYEDNGCNSKRDIIEAMKEYANQKLDEAAEKATCSDYAPFGCSIDAESILSLKDKL